MESRHSAGSVRVRFWFGICRVSCSGIAGNLPECRESRQILPICRVSAGSAGFRRDSHNAELPEMRQNRH